MTLTVKLLVVMFSLSTLVGCTDNPKAPFVDVNDLVTRIDDARDMAEGADADTQYRLGLRYELAKPADLREAVYWYRLAGAQHHPGALYRLCVLSDRGQGLTQDYHEALRWCRHAADQGHARAMLTVATYYDKARAVSRDKVQAHRWFNLAAAYGEPEGRRGRDRIAGEMTQAQIAEAQLLARNWRTLHQETLEE